MATSTLASRSSPQRPLTISVCDNGRLMSAAEFDSHTDWDDNYRYELVRGVLIVNPPPGIGQRDPNDELGYWLRKFAREYPGIIDRTVSEHYILYTENRRLADRVIWTGLGRPPRDGADQPSIAIEFVSSRKRDRIRDYETKRDEYLAAGVREYWVIDRFDRTLTVFRTSEQGIETSVTPESSVIRSPLLPGFELPFAELLAAADLWTQPENKLDQDS